MPPHTSPFTVGSELAVSSIELFIQSLSQGDIMMMVIIGAATAAFLLILNGLIEIAFYFATTITLAIAVWLIASSLPFSTPIAFIAGAVILIIIFLWIA